MAVDVHRALCFATIALAVVTFVVLGFVKAPYGRHARPGWGPTLPARAAWILMESPSCLGFLAVYATGDHRGDLAPLALLALWQAHYAHRAFVYPLRMRPSGRRMPILVALLGVAFNTLNAWLNARWISHLGDYPSTWLVDPRFLAGVALFVAGMTVNRSADERLRRLRAPGETGYKVPRGWLYEYVSCPNYLGEIAEWTGWALATWSLAGLSFAVYTAANLVPRALAHHAWYREQFGAEAPARRALIPFVL